MNDESHEEKMEMKGMGWRVSLSILVGVGWLVFLVLWLFFYAKQYVWEKNVAVLLSSILILCAIVGIPWGIWAIRNRSVKESEMWKTKGFRWRVWVSGIGMLVVFIFLIYWFWVYAAPYDLYQNLAIFIISFLIMAGLLGAMWAPWGMRHGPEYSHAYEKKNEEK
jgi:MFS family permease